VLPLDNAEPIEAFAVVRRVGRTAVLSLMVGDRGPPGVALSKTRCHEQIA